MMENQANDPENSEIGIYKGKEINFDDALNIIGFGKYNIFVTLACGITFFAVNTTIYGVAYILPAAECEFQLNATEKGLFTGITLIGIISSLQVWGALADTTGRRKIILISLISSFLCNLASSFTSIFWFFTLLQFLKGVFVAGSSSIVYAYLGEFHSNHERPKAVAWCTLFMAFALTVLPLTAWLILSKSLAITFSSYNIVPWRFFLILCCLPNLLGAAAIAAFPESPKYLILENRIPEVMDVLKKMYTINTKNTSDSFPIISFQNLNSDKNSIEHSHRTSMSDLVQKLWYQTKPLFYINNIKYTTMACCLQFGAFGLSSGLLLWYPDILQKISENYKTNNNLTLTVCEVLDFAGPSKENLLNCENMEIGDNVFLQNSIIGFTYCVGCFLIGILIDSVGQRFIIILNLLLSAICCILLTIITTPLAIDIIFIAVLVPPGLCVGVITGIVLDMFPTHFKAMAVSISLLIGRVGGASATTMVGFLLELSCNGTFYLYAVLIIGCIFLSLLIPGKKQS